jgi:hypothetical protein
MKAYLITNRIKACFLRIMLFLNTYKVKFVNFEQN